MVAFGLFLVRMTGFEMADGIGADDVRAGMGVGGGPLAGRGNGGIEEGAGEGGGDVQTARI